MNQPYNTGKVQIGRAYIRPPLPLHAMDKDAVQLQSALLEADRPIDYEDRIVLWACVLTVLALLWILS